MNPFSLQSNSVVSSRVASQLPEFVNIDHPTFVAFLEAFYKWIEQNDFIAPTQLKRVTDLDNSLDRFIDHFKAQYLRDFPVQLAFDDATGLPIDERTLIKNIKDFYASKGTEQSYKFLFRVLYDTAVEFYYPKTDILRCSDGKWIQNKSIRTTSSNKNFFKNVIGRNVFQINPQTSLVTSSGRVISASQYQIGNFETTELFLSGINGTFESTKPVYIQDDNGNLISELKIHKVVTSVTIDLDTNGSGYKIGDLVTFSDSPTGNESAGQNAKGVVDRVDSLGGIRKIKITDFGINYKNSGTVSINISSEGGTGFTGAVSNVDVLCEYPGFYQNDDGKISSSKYIQDNHYYQDYSYVLKTELTVDKYRDVIRRLVHPAGLAFFGQVFLQRCLLSLSEQHGQVGSYELPIIGHYTPYTFKTYDDLYYWFFEPWELYINFGKTGSTDGRFKNYREFRQERAGVSGNNAETFSWRYKRYNIRGSVDDQYYTFGRGQTQQGYDPNVHNTLISTLGLGNPITNRVLFHNPVNPLRVTGSRDSRLNPFFVIYHHPNNTMTGGFATISSDLKDEVFGLTNGITNVNYSWPEWKYTNAEKLNWYNSWGPTDTQRELRLDGITYSSEFRKIPINSFLNMPVGDYFDCRYADYGTKDSFGNTINK